MVYGKRNEMKKGRLPLPSKEKSHHNNLLWEPARKRKKKKDGSGKGKSATFLWVVSPRRKKTVASNCPRKEGANWEGVEERTGCFQ